LFDILKQQQLASEMTKKIVSAVEITPEETRTFFKSLSKDDLPLIGAEVEVARIVINPKVSDEEKKVVIDRLKEIKNEVLNGASFTTKAVLYTEDPGSRSTGGYYKMNKKTPFVKEFKDVAFSLQEGEISEPFETEFGYHIIFLEKIRGQDLEIRHILLKPKVTSASLKDAREKADLVRKRIADKELTFEEAARKFSDEKETRANGGVLINPKTQDTHFELTKMDPEMYGQVSNLKGGEMTQVLFDDDGRNGKRYIIMSVTSKMEEHLADFSKDYTKIRELALKEKQLKAIAKWFDEKIKETYIKINAEYRDCKFTNNWLKQ
jgi:peptidyl-prolyl cis-trans isomerase SurA